MNILLCTTRMSIGGAETHVLSLSRALVSLGHSVTVASSGGMLADELGRCGIPHITLPLNKKDPISFARNIAALNRLAHSFDIVHAHGRIPAFVCSTLASSRRFPPFVTTAHGLYTTEEPKKSLSRWGNGVIAVSHDVKNYLRSNYNINPDKIRFIPNGVEMVPAFDKHATDTIEICASARLDADNRREITDILTVTNRLLEEGLNLHLSIIGDGDIFNEIKKQADEITANHHGSITLHGAVPDTRPLIKNCDIFIGQSRSALEAMAQRRATVLFGNSAFDGVLGVENAENLFNANYIPKHSDNAVNDLYTSLKSLITKQTERSLASSAGYYWVRSHNDIEAIAKETLDFYNEIIKYNRPAVMLCGYYGAHNLGDDASLEVIVSRLRKENPTKPIFVITRDPRHVPDGCAGISRVSLVIISIAMRRTHTFILGGGSLLQNKTSNRSLLYYYTVAKLARKNGCQVEICDGGIGPVTGKKAEWRVAEILRLCSSINLRDNASLAYAMQHTTNARLTCDPVLSFRNFEKQDKTDRFAVCIRPISKKTDARNLAELARTIRYVKRETGLDAAVVILSPKDKPLSRKLAEKAGATLFAPQTAKECADTFSRFQFVIGMRLHSAIFPYLSGVPTVCLSYDPKVRAFAAEARLPCLDANSFSADKITEIVNHLPTSEKIEERLNELRGRAATDVQ